MNKKYFLSLFMALVVSVLIFSVAYAGLYVGPSGTVGGVGYSTAHWIQRSTNSFQDRADSKSNSNISRLGGVTFSSRVWCGSVIRNTVNHGGWVLYNNKYAYLYGGMNWGAACTNQKAGTAAQHDFSHGGQTSQPYHYATEPR